MSLNLILLCFAAFCIVLGVIRTLTVNAVPKRWN